MANMNPRIIYIGTWTGHRDSLQRIGRTINLATGEIMSTINKIGYGGKPNAFLVCKINPKLCLQSKIMMRHHDFILMDSIGILINDLVDTSS